MFKEQRTSSASANDDKTRSSRFGSEEERFPSVEHHGDPSVLRFYEAREGMCGRLHGCIGYELRHSSPTRVS